MDGLRQKEIGNRISPCTEWEAIAKTTASARHTTQEWEGGGSVAFDDAVSNKAAL